VPIKMLLSPTSTRSRLLRDLIAIILLTSGAIMAVTLFQGYNMRNDIAQEHIRQSLRTTSDVIYQFYEPVESNASLIQKWGVAGVLDLNDVDSMTTKLIPMMENLPQVAAIKFGNTRGRSYLLSRNKNIWVTRTTSPGKEGVITWQKWAGGQSLEKRVEKTPYNLNQRIWFQEGLSNAPKNQTRVSWLQPYMFDYKETPGLSAIMTWPSVDDADQTCVMALDLHINDLFERIAETKVGLNGAAFLFDGDTSVYHPVGKQASPENSRYFSDHTLVEVPSVRNAMAAWHAKEKPSDAFMFVSEGKNFWAGVQPINTESRDFWIGVVVPQSDFLQKVQKKRWSILVIALSVLGFGLLMAGLLVWKYRHQLRDMPNQVIRGGHFEHDVRNLISRGEGSTLEFKSTMRMNLKSEKNDKNIEIAWMKTVTAFMNTGGGIIVIGVNDDGEITGTAPDGFENEDKCRLHFRNLINQHVGPEFSKNIRLKIGTIDGHTVMVIECERSNEPVFLINKKDEAFYVRSGPSSMSLTMRQMLKYLESRT